MSLTNSAADSYSSCYVAPGRRYTCGSSGSITVLQGGDLALVPNDAVEQLCQDGIILPPGAPYVEPTGGGNMGMPPIPSSGVSKRTFSPTAFPTRQLVTLAPTAGSPTLTLPSTPSDPSSVVITVNERAYVNNGGRGGFTASGQTVTMNFPLQAADIVTAEFR